MSETKLIRMNQEPAGCVVEATALPWVAEGLPPGWSMQLFSAHDMEMYIFRAEPGASWPAHSSPDSWVGLVTAGRMTLELSEADGKPAATVTCEAGDGFTFGPGVRHAWRNAGPEPVSTVFVRTLEPA